MIIERQIETRTTLLISKPELFHRLGIETVSSNCTVTISPSSVDGYDLEITFSETQQDNAKVSS